MENNNNEELEINIQDILNLLRANAVGIIILALIGGILMGCYSLFLKTPLYSAEARMYILSSSSDRLLQLSQLQVSSQLTLDYEEMMMSRPMMEEVIGQLALDDVYTAEQLASCISITNPEDTRILNVAAIAPDPELAANIANTLADVSARNLSDIMETSTPKVYQRAIADYKKVSPNNTKNVMLGLIGGAVIAIALAVLFYLADDTIKTEEDIQKAAGLANFARINGDPANMKKKKKNKNDLYGSYGNYGSYGQ